MEFENTLAVYVSPGFQALCGQFQDTTTLDILEMGPSSSRNIEFWSQYCRSIFVANLRASLPLPSMEEDQILNEMEWNAILNIPGDRNFDVILAWDLLNYIDERLLPGMINYLNRYCKSGTKLFAMTIDRPQMPADGYVFQIIDVDHLGYKASNSPLEPCAMLQPRVFENVMQGFHTTIACRLRHGIIEYLFTFDG